MRANISDSDFLGRAVFSSRQARKASNGMIRFDVFLGKLNESISVDRFGLCSKKNLVKIQDRNAVLRSEQESKTRSFYGWAKIQAIIAKRNGRQVQASSLPSNPYHAEIHLPEKINKDEQITHAVELAKNSEWTAKD